MNKCELSGFLYWICLLCLKLLWKSAFQLHLLCAVAFWGTSYVACFYLNSLCTVWKESTCLFLIVFFQIWNRETKRLAILTLISIIVQKKHHLSALAENMLSTVACKPSVTVLISKANPEQLIFLQWTLSKYCHGMWVQFLEERIYYLVCKMSSAEVSSTQIIPVHKSGDEVLWSQWRAACLLGLKSLVLLMWMGILLKLSAEPGVWSSLESLWSSSLYAALYPEA